MSVQPRASTTSTILWMAALLCVLAFSIQACSSQVPAVGSPSADRNGSGKPRVILFSWDGAAHWTTTEALERADLPQLERLVAEGAWADGMVSSFPTKTAAAHAMLWTGRYGHQSGITANSLLLEPPAEHSRLETRSAFFSGGLKAEPLWVTTARAGLATYALHAPQSYPYDHAQRWLDAASLEHLHLLNGYTYLSMSPAVFSQGTHPPRAASGWSVPQAEASGALELSLTFGDDPWWGLLFDDPNDPARGLDTLGLATAKDSSDFEIVLKPGLDAAPSSPVAVTRDEVTLNATLRLFALGPDDGSYLLYLSGAKELTPSSDLYPGAAELAGQSFAGNGGGWAFGRGAFGPTIPQGGDGTAEDRFLATLADLAAQLRYQARQILDRRDYSLFLHYSPILDDANHTWAGYLDPAMPGHDPALAEAIWPKLLEAYRLNESLLEDVLLAAERDRANLILVSDHGMAGTNRLFNVNVALERAGLLGRTADGRIDLAATRALLLPTSDISMAINTTDRAGGIVPPEKRSAVLDELKKVLEKVRDPATGKRLVTGMFEAATSGPLQPGGVTTGDLFIDLTPGYYPSSRLDPDEIVTVTEPDGNHTFLPTRHDMLSICFAWGPDIPPTTRWPRVRSIDIAPTVLEILGLPIPEDLPGRPLFDRQP